MLRQGSVWSWGGFLIIWRGGCRRLVQAVEWEIRKQAIPGLPINNELLYARQHILHRFNVDAFADDVLGQVVFLKGRQKPICLTLGSGYAGLGIALRLVDHLCGLSFRSGDDVVSVTLGLIDQLFPVLLGAGDIFECRDD